MRSFVVAAAAALTLVSLLATPAHPARAEGVDVPPGLKGWESWALYGSEFVRCPYVTGLEPGEAAGHACNWPGPLDLDANADGARFNLQVRVYAPGWVELPGDSDHWPQDVRADGASASVVERGGRPSVHLDAGSHSIAGRLPWVQIPESIAIPSAVGIVRLTVNGERVAFPEREPDSVRLGASSRTTQSNQIDVRIYRKLTDSVPGMLATRVLLQVSGEAREEFVGPLLPEGFAPVGLRAPLPARLDPDGRLRVQVRAGSWEIELAARAATALGALKMPVPAKGDRADAAEVWSFEAADRLRVTSIEGVAAIDPAQANVPAEWQSLPAYRLEPGAEMRVVERSRGFGGQDLNRIEVERDLWRDFGGSGYTFRDRVSGSMQQRWRLDMAAPYLLQGARAGEQPLLVTRGDQGRAGVEVRSPGLQLEGTGRIERSSGGMPAAGWDARIASLGITLHLPPGNRLLAAIGVDESPSAWMNRWRLLDIFVVLLVAAAAFRIAGWPVAALAAAALTLAHHELHALTWLYLNLLIAIALAGAAPEGRLRFWANTWRNAAFALVLVAFVPFALYQARLAFFPQLESTPVFTGALAGGVGARREMATAPQAVPVAPPPPGIEEMEFNQAMDQAAEAGSVTPSAPVQAKLAAPAPPPPRAIPRYAPGTLLQSGPGVPNWSYQSHRLQWSGPVEPGQAMHLVVLGPWLVSVWRLLAIMLLAVLFVVLARRVFARPHWTWLDRLFGPLTPAAALVLCALCLLPQPLPAQTPSPELLQELKQRLTRPPECAPNCVALALASVNVEGSALEVRLEAHADARAVLMLPAAPQRWSVERVTIDGAAAPLARDAARNLVAALEPGVHEVVLAGPVADADAVRLVFPQRPARIVVSAPGWEIAGVEQQRLLADSLTLSRSVARAAAGEERRLQEEYPPFVRLHRQLALDLEWSVSNTIERIAPEQGAFTLEIPLLPGESVLTSGLPVRDGRVSVSVPAGVASVQWDSALARSDNLSLAAPKDSPWVEVWQVAISPAWRVAFKGTPEVFAAAPANDPWVHDFEPRPGETLELAVTRPLPIEGATVAFEALRQHLAVGQRSTDTTLELAYRSTQGGRHVLKLPAGARLLSVQSDGQPLAVRDENGELALPLQPGNHSFGLTWQQDAGAGLVTRPGTTALGAPASNVSTVITLPQSRWILFAAGGGVGPAILYWAELAVFVVLALLLGRIRRTPLATHEWLLVGLGLSTFSWSVLLLFAAWAFALEWRKGWKAEVMPWVFNAVQVGLALLTVSALGSLVSAIPNGLLGTPDMRIDGAGSSAESLAWFHDRIAGTLPQPVVISVSIWFYKAAMLAWALWLSFALVRWVRWAWDAFTTQRLWYGYEKAPSQ
jgi:hypothetical protein